MLSGYNIEQLGEVPTMLVIGNKCYGSVGNETLGRTFIALNFSHQLNPNLVILQKFKKAAQELKVLLFRCSMFV